MRLLFRAPRSLPFSLPLILKASAASSLEGPLRHGMKGCRVSPALASTCSMAIWFSDMELSVLVRQDRPAGAENLTAGAPSEQKSSAGDCVGDAEKSFWRTET